MSTPTAETTSPTTTSGAPNYVIRGLAATGGPDWPTAVGWKNLHELSPALLQMASLHARRAVLNIGSTDPLELLDQAVSIGASMELLVKAILAGIDPQLIRGTTKQVETTLALIGRPTRVGPIPDLSTVGGRDGFTRLNDVLASIGVKKKNYDCDARIFHVRDSAVHMGLVDPTQNDAVLQTMARTTKDLLKLRQSLGQSTDWNAEWSSYWGDTETDVDAIVRRAEDAISSSYELVIKEARRNFKKRFPGDDAPTLVAIETLEGQAPRTDYNEVARHHICPGCGHRGWVTYDKARSEPILEASNGYCDPYWYVAVSGFPTSFSCLVCGLELFEYDDLHLAKIYDIELDNEEIDDVPDFDEDAYRDREAEEYFKDM